MLSLQPPLQVKCACIADLPCQDAIGVELNDLACKLQCLWQLVAWRLLPIAPMLICLQLTYSKRMSLFCLQAENVCLPLHTGSEEEAEKNASAAEVEGKTQSQDNQQNPPAASSTASAVSRNNASTSSKRDGIASTTANSSQGKQSKLRSRRKQLNNTDRTAAASASSVPSSSALDLDDPPVMTWKVSILADHHDETQAASTKVNLNTLDWKHMLMPS